MDLVRQDFMGPVFYYELVAAGKRHGIQLWILGRLSVELDPCLGTKHHSFLAMSSRSSKLRLQFGPSPPTTAQPRPSLPVGRVYVESPGLGFESLGLGILRVKRL